MCASFPSNEQFANDISAKNSWLLGEKYDGIRCCWHTKNKTLYGRSGIELMLPSSFADYGISNFVDGEIWFGRGYFQEAQVFAKSSVDNISWPYFRILGFDDPGPSIQMNPFKERYGGLLSATSSEHPFLIPAMRLFCTSKEQLTWFTHQIISATGEGVILQKPQASYEQGRVESLIKLKSARGDMEALIADVAADGSYFLRMPNEIVFEVSAENVKLETKAKKGDIVTFSYDSYTNRNVPSNPTVYRIRTDVLWEDVVFNFEQNIAFSLNSYSQIGRSRSPALGDYEKGKHTREVFERFAEHSGFDPLVSENWYLVQASDFAEFKGAAYVLALYNKSFIKALLDAFPDIGLDDSRFPNISRGYWENVGNRRIFFDNFAKERGFNPLVPTNWYSVSPKSVKDTKGGIGILSHYDDSLHNALLHLYPNIGLDSVKLLHQSGVTIQMLARQLLEKYAKEHFLDPLLAESWFPITFADITANKGADAVLTYFNNNLRKTIVCAFPELNVDELQYKQAQQNFWQSERNRAAIFEKFAEKHKFDPRVADNWYPVTVLDFLDFPGGKAVLKLYKGMLGDALLHLFPDINLDPHRLRNISVDVWKNLAVQRSVLTNFAKSHGFDHLIYENWLSFASQMTANEAIAEIIGFYDGSAQAALRAVYPNIDLRSPALKEFLANFAGQAKFDPSVAGNWYSVTAQDIIDKGGKPLLHLYDMNLPKAVAAAFPTLELEESKFSSHQRNYWQNRENRRNFFLDYARKSGRDALNPETWYSANLSQILSHKGGKAVLEFYDQSLFRALFDLFPAIGLHENSFKSLPQKYWQDEANQRKFFEEFARNRNFNPLDPENWYPITSKMLLEVKGASTLLSYYQGSFATALSHLFPTIGLDVTKFTAIPRGYWQDERNCRAFLCDFAEKQGFNPFVPHNWRLVAQHDFSAAKRAKSILKYYDGSLTKALTKLFPEHAAST
eukprot:Phypoly_transcript_01165.p1 GENE.Phypoly_transcript_01165~~Phypoly_transcript_01165.p1  ORF type:complete len:960 (+),score=125.04 Phypoly_transcript_01165:678-3557(+)